MITRLFLFLPVFFISTWAINLNNTVWETNWNVMSFWQDGNKVSAEYMYDGGIITGILSGDTLRGWWREYGNIKECGPENTWCGPLLFKFSADGKSFTGSWGYCNADPSTLNSDASDWTGTIKEGVASYTQKECEDAGRYWCNNGCNLVPCDSAITKEACEHAGRFWCSNTCKMTPCEGTSIQEQTLNRPIKNGRKTSIGHHFCGANFDLRGKRLMDNVNGISIYIDATGKSRTRITILP